MKTVESLFHLDSNDKKEKLGDRLAWLLARNNGSLVVTQYGGPNQLNQEEAMELLHLSGVVYGFVFSLDKQADLKWQRENIIDPLKDLAKRKGWILF